MGSRLPFVVALLVLAAGVGAGCGRTGFATSAAAGATPQAAPVDPDPRVGAIFLDGADMHSCTGSVLDSPHGDLVLTAAHCVADGITTDFVPAFTGYAPSIATWRVDAIYVDPRWLADTDPHADYAVLRVRGSGAQSIEQAVGSGLTVGAAPHPGAVVTVTGYPYGVGGGPVSCHGPTESAHAGYPSLACRGLVDGTSGAPWMSGSTVLGVTGGFDKGGCDDDMSYASPFDAGTAALVARAALGGPGDAAPNTFDIGC
jgi:trypsin-like peptidase